VAGQLEGHAGALQAGAEDGDAQRHEALMKPS
jgi:hypothetical protein